MLESEYGTQEVKYKSKPFPASRKESRLGLENKTIPSLCPKLPLFGLLPGLGRLSRIDSGSTPTIYMESGQSHVLPTSCPPTQGAIILTGLCRWAGKLEPKYLPFLSLPQDSCCLSVVDMRTTGPSWGQCGRATWVEWSWEKAQDNLKPCWFLEGHGS